MNCETSSEALSGINELHQIAQYVYVTEIENLCLLFHRGSGNVSKINSSAALLIKLAQSGLTDQEITQEVSLALGVSQAQIRQDLNRLKADLLETDQHDEFEEDSGLLPVEHFQAGVITEPYSHYDYMLGGKAFSVSYPDAETQAFCHAILQAMCLTSAESLGIWSPDFHLDLRQGQNGWGIYQNNKIQYAVEDKASQADILRLAILDTIGSQIKNWAGLHAAGILNANQQVLLLAAPSGSGKSTLTLELILRGYGYLGDDTQVLDLDRQLIWPFPTAVNLKAGSWDLFEAQIPALANTPVFRPEVRPVKFLPMPVDLKAVNRPYPTKALIFPVYHEGASGTIAPLALEERIPLLSDSGCYSRVEASAEMSQKYLEYILSVDAYTMEYSSSEQAIILLEQNKLLG